MASASDDAADTRRTVTDVPTVASPRQYDDPQRWWILAACCTVAFALQAEPFLWMIGYEIPSSAFGTGWTEYRVLASLGVLLFVAFQLVGGVLGDLLGRRKILLIGAIGATLFNVISLLAPTLLTLIVIRAMVGVMGALAFPLSLALIRLTFEGTERTRALVIYTFVTGVGVLASLLGILFEDWWGWRAALVLPIVVGVAGAYLAWRYVPESRAQGGFGRIEAINAAAWALVFLAAMFGLVMANLTDTWRNPITVAAGGFVALGVLLLSIWIQFAGKHRPFRGTKEVPRHFLSLLLLVSAALNFGLVGYAQMLYGFFFTARQLPGFIAGVALAPVFLGNLFVLRWAARFTTSQPAYVAVGGGLATMGVAMLLTALARPNTPYLVLVPLMMLFGLGFLIASASWAYFFFAALPADLIGLSSGLNRAAGLVGSGLAGVLLASVLALSGTADFKLRMAELRLNAEQQAIALQVVDIALRQGITADDLTRTPVVIAGLGLMAAYREAFSVGVASALILAGTASLAVAAVAWFWLRGVQRAADDTGETRSQHAE
ncbi:MFS transporter [Candidatus Chloroploca sp. Khr17]|uniref:MFS transporter n=1 Tax=Candidatus Chloroploca sp. Khr17 TaxID=2496869 RepID=UPI00101D7EDF|nr:MFS transporter [Candidatus Chloroploca sp. Khr17]